MTARSVGFIETAFRIRCLAFSPMTSSSLMFGHIWLAHTTVPLGKQRYFYFQLIECFKFTSPDKNSENGLNFLQLGNTNMAAMKTYSTCSLPLRPRDPGPVGLAGACSFLIIGPMRAAFPKTALITKVRDGPEIVCIKLDSCQHDSVNVWRTVCRANVKKQD